MSRGFEGGHGRCGSDAASISQVTVYITWAASNWRFAQGRRPGAGPRGGNRRDGARYLLSGRNLMVRDPLATKPRAPRHGVVPGRAESARNCTL